MPPNGYNVERSCNPLVEAAQRDALEHVDRKTRTAAYARIEYLVARDLPVLPLWWPRAVHVISTRVRGFAPNGLVSSWNSWEWSLARD